MIKALFFFCRLTILVLIAIWFAHHPGKVEINWYGYAVSLPVGILFLLLFIFIYLLLAVKSFLHIIERYIDRRTGKKEKKKQQKGFQAIARGFSALAAHNKQEALLQSQQAGRNLPDDHAFLSSLLTVIMATSKKPYSATDCKDAPEYQATETALQQLIAYPSTAFLGYKGLALLYRQQKLLAKSLEAANKALNLIPANEWAIKTVLSLNIKLEDYAEAYHLLRLFKKHKLVDKIELNLMKASILYLRSQKTMAENLEDDAITHAVKAHTLLPANPFLAVQAAKALNKQEKYEQTHKILDRCWHLAPHLVVANAMLDLPIYKDSNTRLELARGLCNAPKDNQAGLAFMADLLLQQYQQQTRPQAKDVLFLTDLVMRRTGLSGEIYYQAARLAEIAGLENTRITHLYRLAAEHKHSNDLHCGSCGYTTKEWLPVCPSCESVGSFNEHPPSTSNPALLNNLFS
ncbi:MAG: heme biosynthesis HemY N-terminal domain-containing protein [Alphaproteobacteria bacterium]